MTDEQGHELTPCHANYEEAAALAFQSGDYVRAERWLLRARPSGSAPWALDHNLGLVQAALGKHREAVESFTRAMVADPDSVASRGFSFDALGELDKAEADYLAAIRAHPDDVDSLVNLGLLYITREDWSTAGDLLGRAAKLDQSAGWPYADVLIHRGDVREARRLLMDVVSAGEARANLDLALLDIQDGHFDEGETRLLLAIDAGATRGRVEYATFLLNQGRTAEALQVARTGVEEGDDWSYAPLAVALTRLQRCDEASEHARTAIRLGDRDYLRSMLRPRDANEGAH